MIIFEIGTVAQLPAETTTSTGKTYLQFALQVATEKGTNLTRDIKIWNPELINYAKQNLQIGMPVVVRGTPDISAYVNQQGKATYSFRINASAIDLMILQPAQPQQNYNQPTYQAPQQNYNQPQPTNFNQTQQLQPNPQQIQNQLIGDAFQTRDVTNTFQPVPQQLNNLHAVPTPSQYVAPQKQNQPQPYTQNFNNNFGNR